MTIRATTAVAGRDVQLAGQFILNSLAAGGEGVFHLLVEGGQIAFQQIVSSLEVDVAGGADRTVVRRADLLALCCLRHYVAVERLLTKAN
jgi:hypothetical protein